MKINWAVGIAVLYMGFVAMILVLVSMSIGQNIDLATEHYYEEELGFQDKIGKKERSKALVNPLKWTLSETGITIFYPQRSNERSLTGQIKLYCPADKQHDRQFNIAPNNQIQFIPTANIPEGNYHLQIDWKNDNQTYWNEDVIQINHPN